MWMTNPAVPGSLAEVDDAAFARVWRHKGWEPAPAPVEEDLPASGPVAGSDAAAAAAAQARSGFDPAAYTVDEVLAHLERADLLERRRVLRAESGVDVDGSELAAAKQRTTILSHAERLGVPASDLSDPKE